VADLDERRHDYHVAIENWQHDANIGTVVRNANAFLAAAVHIVGNRRWNRRGAMVTDRYQHVVHHPTIGDLVVWAAAEDLAVIGIDNLPGSVPLETAVLPERCVLLFGQEGPGLSDPAREACALVCSITQGGSTRSINAGVASGIAMHTWLRQHRL
jgi:tRNA G18 (ribose-2'-O)-methylase SpoU